MVNPIQLKLLKEQMKAEIIEDCFTPTMSKRRLNEIRSKRVSSISPQLRMLIEGNRGELRNILLTPEDHSLDPPFLSSNTYVQTPLHPGTVASSAGPVSAYQGQAGLNKTINTADSSVKQSMPQSKASITTDKSRQLSPDGGRELYGDYRSFASKEDPKRQGQSLHFQIDVFNDKIKVRPEEEPKLFAMDNLLRNAFGKKGSFDDSRISTALLRSNRRH